MVQRCDLNPDLHEQGEGLPTCELLADILENSEQSKGFVEVEPDLGSHPGSSDRC